MVYLTIFYIIKFYLFLGYHGRNIKYISQKARVELIKLFKKDFKITTIVKKRTHKLEEYGNFPDIEEIIPKKFPIEDAKAKLKQLKLERKDKLIEKEMSDSSELDSDIDSDLLKE